jgi:hypothetical protein
MPQVFIFVSVVDVFGGEVVLDNLVFDDTHAGLSHGHLGRGIRALLAASAAARKILSTCSCEKLANSRCASLTRATSASSSAKLVTAMFIS